MNILTRIELDRLGMDPRMLSVVILKMHSRLVTH